MSRTARCDAAACVRSVDMARCCVAPASCASAFKAGDSSDDAARVGCGAGRVMRGGAKCKEDTCHGSEDKARCCACQDGFRPEGAICVEICSAAVKAACASANSGL